MVVHIFHKPRLNSLKNYDIITKRGGLPPKIDLPGSLNFLRLLRCFYRPLFFFAEILHGWQTAFSV